MADASMFNIQGATKLMIATGADTDSPTFNDGTILGWTDNDNLISVDFDNMHTDVYSTESGQEPAARIYQGTVATITATLIKWNQASKDTLFETMWQDADSPTQPGVIGQDALNPSYTQVDGLHVKIQPMGQVLTNADVAGYWFKKCWVESIAETDWGNAPKKLVVTFKAVRSSGNVMYVRA